MRQQINLYQPIFRPQRRPFAAGTGLLSLALVGLALLATWGYGLMRVTHLGDELVKLRAQQQQLLQIAALGGTAHARRQSPEDLQARADRLLLDLKQRQQALEVLRSGAAGDTGGFAHRLEALAHRHVDGLWLDQIVLGAGAGVASLSGRTLDPQLVPVYLQALTAEAALSGTRFEQFRIEAAPAVAADGETSSAPAPAKRPPVLRFQAQTGAEPAAPAKSSS